MTVSSRSFSTPRPPHIYPWASSVVAAATLLWIPLLTKPCPRPARSCCRGLRITTSFELTDSFGWWATETYTGQSATLAEKTILDVVLEEFEMYHAHLRL